MVAVLAAAPAALLPALFSGRFSLLALGVAASAGWIGFALGGLVDMVVFGLLATAGFAIAGGSGPVLATGLPLCLGLVLGACIRHVADRKLADPRAAV